MTYLSSLSSFDSSYFSSNYSFRFLAFKTLILLLCFSPSVSLMFHPSLNVYLAGSSSEIIELSDFFRYVKLVKSLALYFSTWSALNWSHLMIYEIHSLYSFSSNSNSIHFKWIVWLLILLNSLLLNPILPFSFLR